jgi:hypothetical protein
MFQAEQAACASVTDGSDDTGADRSPGPVVATMAQEVKRVGERIAYVSTELSGRLAASMAELRAFSGQIVQQMQGARLSDLAYTIVETIDRSLYERSCDLRWWATDAPIVAALSEGPAAVPPAQARLAAMLGAYKACLDIWIADARGRIVASGRADPSGSVLGADVSRDDWFSQAMAGRPGEDCLVGEVTGEPRLGGAAVVTLAVAIAGHDPQDRPAGTLAVHFDWQPRAAAVFAGVRLAAEEKPRTRCMLLDADGRVIAASDGGEILAGTIPIDRFGDGCGHHVDETGCQVAYARSPGHETFAGLGWYAVIVQAPAAA